MKSQTKNIMRRVIAGVICGLSILSAIGNETSSDISPVINKDSSVTFRFKDDAAEEVYLRGSFIPITVPINTPAGVFGKSGKYEMKRIGGYWTYTTKPLESELYTYYFEVDGERKNDPMNDLVLKDVNSYLNYFIICNGIADNYCDHDVPHGTVQKVWYNSSIPGMPKRRMTIYTPPQYDTNKKQSYPVLYLLHGSGGDENAWVDAGRAIQILDNLIAQKECVPMIVVMPNGIANQEAAAGENPYSDEDASSMNIESMFGIIEKAFVPDIVNYVDAHYRTVKKKQGRAIAGLSLGGLHTLFITANNPDVFDYVGLFSAQTTNLMNDKKHGERTEKIANTVNQVAELFPFLKKGKLGKKITDLASSVSDGDLSIYEDLDSKLASQFKEPPQLYYIAVGRDDFVKKLNDDLRLKLHQGGYNFHYNETDGGHSWENWRKNLVDFLPRLFK